MSLPVRLQHFALEQVPSFSSYLPYLAYDEEEQVYLVSKDADPTNLAWGVIFECLPHPGPGESQANNLKNFFELMWPPGTSLQISTLGLQTEAIPRLLHYRSERRGAEHVAFATRRMQRLARLLMSGHQSIQTAPLRDHVVLVSFSVPVNPISLAWWQKAARTGKSLLGRMPATQRETIMAALPAVHQLAVNAEQLLTQANLAPLRVPPTRLFNLLFPILNPAHPFQLFADYEQDRELRKQMVMADTRVVPAIDGFQIDGWHYRSITPLQLPNEFTIDQMARVCGDLVNTTQQIPSSYMLTLNAVAYDRVDTNRALHRKFAIVSQQSVGPMARIIPRLGIKSQHYQVAMHGLEQGLIPLSSYLHLLVWSPNESEARYAAAASEALWRSMGFIPQADGPASLNIMRESLPLALSSNAEYLQRDLARARTILSSNCASLSPIAGDWKGSGKPILLLVSRRGQIAGVDLFAKNLINANSVVAGVSGSGKSVLSCDLVLNLVGTGGAAWIVDKGRSYERLVKNLNGDYLMFSTENPVNLNPFSLIADVEEFKNRTSGLKALLSQMASPSRQIEDIEEVALGKAMEDAFAEHGNKTVIGHIAERLSRETDPRKRDLAEMLWPYAKGEYSQFFDGPATINVMDSKLLLLELEELSTKPKLQSVIFLALILAIQAAMERGDRKVQKLVLIDEAWSFLQSAQAANFVKELVRRARKYNLSIQIVTQSLVDLVETEAGQTVLANCDTRFIFGHKGEALKDPRLALTPYETQMIRSLTTVKRKYSEVYVQQQHTGGVFRHIIDPISYALFTTEPNEVARITELQKRDGLTLLEAMKVFADNDEFEGELPESLRVALE
jgi:conjugal transfer ATP-binding protein TraC